MPSRFALSQTEPSSRFGEIFHRTSTLLGVFFLLAKDACFSFAIEVCVRMQ